MAMVVSADSPTRVAIASSSSATPARRLEVTFALDSGFTNA
jgi:hypothetical protein